MTLHWDKVTLEDGSTEWRVYVDEGGNRRFVAKGTTHAEALERALMNLEFRVLDRADFPPGKIASFSKDGNWARNVAVLRTALHSLYEEIKALEEKLPQEPHSIQDCSVNGISALLAVKFDWFSISMLNLMEGVSLLDTLAHVADYSELASTLKGMKVIRDRAREYTETIAEAAPLRLWRDKVAAHRSGIVPPPRGRADDAITTKLISLMGIQVGAKNGRYVAPMAIPFANWKDAENRELKEWSLTQIWEDLVSNRYTWLGDGHFFDEIDDWRVSDEIRLHSMRLRNLNEREIRQIKAAGFPPSLDFTPEQ